MTAPSSDALPETLWSQTNDVLFRLNAHGRFIAVNDVACELYGYTQDEFLQLGIADLVEPESLPLARRHLGDKLEGRATRTAPYDLLTRGKGSRRIWLEVATRLVSIHEGLHVIQGMGRDVTARKQAEATADLLHEAALAFNQEDTLDTALGIVLGRLAQAAGWLYAEAAFPEGDGTSLAVGPQWVAEPGFEKFLRLSRQMRWIRGEGLAGHVWETGKTLFGDRLPEGRNFPRLAPAQAAGFRSFAAIPVIHHGQVLAVLVFLGRSPQPRDEHWVRVGERIAQQLGLAVSRRLEVERVRSAARLYAAQFEAVDDGLLILDMEGVPFLANGAFLALCGARLTSTDAAVRLLDRLEDREGFLLAVAALYEDRRAGRDRVDFAGQTWSRNLQILRSRKGQEIGVLLHVRPRRDAEPGQP